MTNSTETMNLDALNVATQDDYVVMEAQEFAKHVARVNTLCGFLEGMIKALANNPMFAAMIPPEMLMEAKNL